MSSRIDLVKYRSLWFGISGAILIPGLFGIIACLVQFHAPLKPGIDFTGGSILQYQFEKPAPIDKVRDILDHSGLAGSQVQQATVSGKDVVIMRTKALDDENLKRKLDASKVSSSLSLV